MVKITQIVKHEHSDTRALNLTSLSDKIHRIQGLQRFTQLQSLNLANNMITRIQNITALTQLKILNLDFNQISQLNNLQHLQRLEQLSISYNCLSQITDSIRYNRSLKVLHIAYNDIRSIQNIQSLSTVQSLAVLSLAGNPFLTALSYISFIKLIIPSLLILDSRDVNQPIVTSCVHPHQQIFILRDALNKLIDQRNSMLMNQQSEIEEASPIKQHDQSQSINQLLVHKHSFGKPMPQPPRQQLTNMFEEWIQNHDCKLEVKKLQIVQLSQAYSSRLASKTVDHFQTSYPELGEKIKKLRKKGEKGLLTSQKKERLREMEHQLQQQDVLQERRREESRKALNNLKMKESEYCRLKQKNVVMRKILSAMGEHPSQEPHKLLLSQVLHGQSTFNINYKSLKKYLFYPKGIIQIVEMLNNIVFGQAADYERILRLRQFLEEKSLIQIINNLKEIGIKHQKQRKKYQKEKNRLITKIQSQAQQLCEEWKQLQKEKWILKNSRQVDLSSPQHEDSRWTVIQSQEKSRIMNLKKEKEHYQVKLSQLKRKNDELQIQFERKYKELEQFQLFFQEFKKDKESVASLKEEKQELEGQIHSKNKIVFQIEQNIKELASREEILQQKSTHFERKAFEKAQELHLYEEKLKSIGQKLRKFNEQGNLKNYQFINLQQNVNKLLEENRQYQKKIQRSRNSLELYEDKLKNLSEIETNKKNTLISIEHEIESQRKRLNDLHEKSEQAEQKLNHNMQMSYQYQQKIQEGKKSVESLSDINHTLSDMMERQTQLKRNNFELQLQNQHLLEMKSKLVEQIKAQYDDQDQTL